MKINSTTTTGRRLRIGWTEDGHTVEVERAGAWLILTCALPNLDAAATELRRLSNLKPTLIRERMRFAERGESQAA